MKDHYCKHFITAIRCILNFYLPTTLETPKSKSLLSKCLWDVGDINGTGWIWSIPVLLTSHSPFNSSLVYQVPLFPFCIPSLASTQPTAVMVNFMWQLGHAMVASWLVKPSLNVATGVLQTWLPSVISRLWAMHINLHNAGGTPPNKLKTFRTKILPRAYNREILPEFPACRLASPQNRMSQFSKIFIHPPIQPSNLNLSLSPSLPLPHPLPLSLIYLLLGLFLRRTLIHWSTLGQVSLLPLFILLSTWQPDNSC